MQRKQRDTTIFSLSALDLFCSAMGVFMVLCFIVFPFYKKESPAPPQPAPELPPRPQPEKQVIAGLTIAFSWDSTGGSGQPASLDDMDLHVHARETGKGELHYYFEKKRHGESPALLVTDSILGGNEVWLHPAVKPGEYQVSYCYYANKLRGRGTGATAMQLHLIVVYGGGETKEFHKQIPFGSIRPDPSREYPWVNIKVREDGDVDFQEI